MILLGTLTLLIACGEKDEDSGAPLNENPPVDSIEDPVESSEEQEESQSSEGQEGESEEQGEESSEEQEGEESS